MIKNAWHNFELAQALNKASLITSDSVGACLASLLLDKKLVYRYPGIEMMEDLIKQGWKVFLLGGRRGVAEEASRKIREKYPYVKICGAHHGYFKNNEEEKVISKINTLKPDIVFIGLNIPYQEIWIDKNRCRINAELLVGVGGSFDVISGRLKRAPYILRTTGAEWFWRLAIQPERIRKVIKLPLFLMETVWRFLKGNPLL